MNFNWFCLTEEALLSACTVRKHSLLCFTTPAETQGFLLQGSPPRQLLCFAWLHAWANSQLWASRPSLLNYPAELRTAHWTPFLSRARGICWPLAREGWLGPTTPLHLQPIAPWPDLCSAGLCPQEKLELGSTGLWSSLEDGNLSLAGV